jgi:hypothetical protein
MADITLYRYVTREIYYQYRKYVVEQHGQLEGSLVARPEAEWAKLFAEWAGLYCGHLGGDAQGIDEEVQRIVDELLLASPGNSNVVQVDAGQLHDALIQLLPPLRSRPQLNEIKHAARHIIAMADELQEVAGDS